MSDITIENANFTGGLLLPGVILCDDQKPCTNFRFTNVENSGLFLVQPSYSCRNADMSQSGSTPALNCSYPSTQ